MTARPKAANRDLAAVALATGKTVVEAAAAASVVERTVYGWNAEPEFRERVSELRREMVSRASGELAEAMSAAAKKLRKLVDSTSDNIALRGRVRGHRPHSEDSRAGRTCRRVEQLEQALVRVEQQKQETPVS